MSSGDTSTKTNGLEYTIIVARREIDGENEFLMVRHPERGWELPGGKFEGKEGPVHCALREFKEETGHLLAAPRFVMKQQRSNGLCYVFTGGLGEKVTAPDEDVVVEMAWFRRLPTENLAFPDDPYQAIGDALEMQFN